MKVREHFMLGTELATITATAKRQCGRADLFYHVLESILARYQEEFGKEAYLKLRQHLSSVTPETVDWRLRPEDSCWHQVGVEQSPD